MDDRERAGEVRVDKWLWAARFFKSRSQATEAVAGGKVQVNGERAKPARTVKPGDEVRLRAGPFEHVLRVRALAERRGPASVAQALYEETADSLAARQRLAEQHRLSAMSFDYDEGRPDKQQRRALQRFKGRG